MKILKDNYKQIDVEKDVKRFKPYPRKLVCEQCGSELEYEKADTRIGEYGCTLVDCPLCGRANALGDDENAITLTIHNIEFPIHFHHTCKEDGAIDVCNNDEIRKCIQRAVEYFRKNKDEFVWRTQHGNLSLIVFRYEGDEDYEVTLTDNYYDTYIPFEDEDYK